MILLYFRQVVNIVDHGAEGSLHSDRGGIAKNIDAFEFGAILEVKARHRVERFRTTILLLKKILFSN